MGFNLHDGFLRHEEANAAWLTEREYAEMAQGLKALAAERGTEPGPLLDRLAEKGLGAALEALAQTGDTRAEADYLRCRAQARQGGSAGAA